MLKAAALIAALTAPIAAHAAVIDNAAFFTGPGAVHLAFETNGSGQAVSLIQGQTLALAAGEYASQGITFDRNLFWVNDGTATFDAAQMTGGSPAVAIPSSQVNEFEIIFTTPAQAVGFFVVNNRRVDPAGPTFTALNAQGGVIESVQFAGGLIDGTFSNASTTADYGFMGISSATPIARLRVQKTAAILDDLRFISVPAPSALALLGLGGAVVARRRR